MAPRVDSTLEGLPAQKQGLPAWDDDGFLVFMDRVTGTHAPSGDLRFMVQTATAGRQLVIVQCQKSGRVSSDATDRTASPRQIKKHVHLLRDCVQR